MNQNADGIAVGSVGVCTKDISLEQFRIMPLYVLGGNDDFDLYKGDLTV